MKPIKIALVEDNDDIRNSLQLLINSDVNFHCDHVFNNGEDAVAKIPDSDLNIVLMDIDLPGINGIDCIKKLKQIRPELLFMMVTVYEDDEKIFDALSAGASGYMLKKTSPEKILAAIKELNEGGAPMSAQIAKRLINYFQSSPANVESDVLSKREMEIIEQLAKGFLYKEIASLLNITVGTVKQHLHRIYEKLHVQNKTEAINKVFHNKN